MAGAFADAIAAEMRRRGIVLRRLRLVQDNFYTMRGSALKGAMTAGALPVEITVEVDAGPGTGVPDDLVATVLACPLVGLVRPGLHSRFSLTRQGRTIPPERVRAADVPPAPDPAPWFDLAQPEGDPGAVQRDGLTPQTEEDTSHPGSSLAEEQDRRLHLRGICVTGPDGVSRIEQRMYNPCGTIFHFVCDPTGQRAPDPLAYFSAGIAFCFMTQLARYAKIARRQLHGCRVVQDTVFRTGAAADPVVTHMYLETEDDEFARTLLAMGEQTCFVHALCRSEMDVQVRVNRVPLIV
jgi:uncharacterized OsmC-like protein